MLPRKLDVQGIGMTSQRTRNRLVARLRENGICNEAVLAVISKTPRHLLVDEALASRAYEDTALPIGHGQTISQPYIVARMTELLLAVENPPAKYWKWEPVRVIRRRCWRHWLKRYSRWNALSHCIARLVKCWRHWATIISALT